MDKKEKTLTNYLAEKYNAVGIVLVGSRVTENVHKKTDWDLFVFTNKTEADVDDFADLRVWEGELLEITPISIKEMEQKDFILDSATHPFKEFKVLYDNTNGALAKICERTKETWKTGPKKVTLRQKDLAIKILTKYIRKAEARGSQPEVLYFATSQFFIYAVRYWFQFHERWPEPIHQALATIKQYDPTYESILRKLLITKTSDAEAVLKTMKTIQTTLACIKV